MSFKYSGNKFRINICILSKMNHLSNKTNIGIMVFYSVLTYFLGPYLVRPILKENPHVHVYGFVVGFLISVVLWMKFGRNYLTN